jgi:hypothetical protein
MFSFSATNGANFRSTSACKRKKKYKIVGMGGVPK